MRKLATKCKKCPYVLTCDHKEMEAVGVLPLPLGQSYAQPPAAPLMKEMAVKHDYRDIKIGENTTVTIDLEDLKKKLVEDFYKGIFNLGG